MTAPDTEPLATRSRSDQVLVTGLIAALGLLALKCAWVCDDAYITFRVVENFTHGHGLRWNVAERVQAYTNPLWLAAMSAAVLLSKEVYLTSIALGVAATLLTAWMLAARVARDAASAVLALLVLAGSKAFVDYSTSGLENPLLHLTLVGALASASTRSSPLALGLWTSAAALTRLDSLVLLAPALFHTVSLAPRWIAPGSVAEQPSVKRRVARLALGLVPLALWELFSLVYYGALTPNTAIAKLNTGLGRGELAAQGVEYLLDSLRRDPLTLTAIVGAIALAVARRPSWALALAAGIALHVGYVVSVGGDFMSGRFLSAPLCAAVFVLVRLGLPRAWSAGVALLALAMGVANPNSPLRAPLDYSRGRPPAEHIDAGGIADERGYWYSASGLFSPTRSLATPPYRHISRGHGLGLRLRQTPEPPQLVEGIGYLGYWAGPQAHLIDPMGLSDAFIARLPIVVDGELVRPDKNRFRERRWRVGHYYRDVPAAYVEALKGEPTRFDDEELRELYEDVLLITRGALFTRERWAAILRRAR